jgi:hypothetical protein
MPMETEASQHPNHPLINCAALEFASKSIAITALLLYGCGFIVSSIQHFSYGFLETNPFRPRILSAGVWFFLFVAIPVFMVIENRKLRLIPGDRGAWLRRFSSLLFFYCITSYGIGVALQLIFLSKGEISDGNSIYWNWTTLLLVVSVAAVVVSDQWQKFPKAIAPIASIVLTIIIIFDGGRDILNHRATPATTAVWCLGLVGIIYGEMYPRSWELKAGNWTQSISFLLIGMYVFALFYYPHITSSWGGGAPIPITIFFSKDSVAMPSQNMAVLLLDESDAGLYVVGKESKKAAFIPRSAIGLIYYSDDTTSFFLTKPR